MYQSANFDEDQEHAPESGRAENRPRFASLRSALFRIGAATLIGGLAPMLFIETTPQKFTAETRLTVKSADDRRIADALAELRSKRSLDNIIRALNLGQDGEFAGGEPGIARVLLDIVSGEQTTIVQEESRLRERLSQAIGTRFDPDSGEILISATATDATGATQIVNLLGAALRDELTAASGNASDPLAEKLRRTLDHAEAALAGFNVQSGEKKLAELRRWQAEGRQLGAEIADGEARLADLKQKAAVASAMKVEDVLAKPLPDSLEYTGLDYQRQRHVEAKLAADQLSDDLGPRHPRLLAAQAALNDVRADIGKTLKQLAATLRQQEREAASHLADLKARQAKTSDNKEIADSAARLATLEGAAAEARQNYLEAVSHSDVAAGPSRTKVEVLAPATAENARSIGFSLPGAIGGGAVVGLCLGLLLTSRISRRQQSEVMPEEAIAEDAPGSYSLDDGWVENIEEVFEANDVHEHDRFADGLYSRYPAPANDSPLAEQIREMLMANSRAAERAEIPPLVAAVMSGHVRHEPSYGTPDFSQDDIGRTEEVRELRRNIAELRERVQSYSQRRHSAQ